MVQRAVRKNLVSLLCSELVKRNDLSHPRSNYPDKRSAKFYSLILSPYPRNDILHNVKRTFLRPHLGKYLSVADKRNR